MPGCPPVRCQWRTDYCQEGCTWYLKSVKRKKGIARAAGRKEKQKKPALLSFRSLQSQSPDSPFPVRPSNRVTKRRAPVVRLTVRVRVRPFVAARTGWHWMAWLSWQARHAAVRSFVRSFFRRLQLPPIPPISTPSFYPAESVTKPHLFPSCRSTDPRPQRRLHAPRCHSDTRRDRRTCSRRAMSHDPRDTYLSHRRRLNAGRAGKPPILPC